jgi:hypothetical protein
MSHALLWADALLLCFRFLLNQVHVDVFGIKSPSPAYEDIHKILGRSQGTIEIPRGYCAVLFRQMVKMFHSPMNKFTL